MKSFNLNDAVKVKLTPKGKEIYLHKFDELNAVLIKNGKEPVTVTLPKEDENGLCTFQLHDLMKLYGSHMVLGSVDTGIENITIYIDDKHLHDAVIEKKQKE